MSRKPSIGPIKNAFYPTGASKSLRMGPLATALCNSLRTTRLALVATNTTSVGGRSFAKFPAPRGPMRELAQKHPAPAPLLLGLRATPSHATLPAADGLNLSHRQGCCAAQQN